MNAGEVIAIIRNQAQLLGVDPDLAVAIAYVESRYQPLTTRFEPAWRYFLGVETFARSLGITSDTERVLQSISFGVMQVMGSVARELSFRGHLTQLCEPECGAEYGCRKLAQLAKRFEDEDALISAYNAGTPKRVAGRFANQEYVDKVRVRLNALRAIN